MQRSTPRSPSPDRIRFRELALTRTGRHHEIYLSDARKTAPARLRTILRQPVNPSSLQRDDEDGNFEVPVKQVWQDRSVHEVYQSRSVAGAGGTQDQHRGVGLARG